MVTDGKYRYVWGRLLRIWTIEEEYFMISHLTIWTDSTIARHLGRTEYAVRKYRQRLHQHYANQDLISTGQLAKLVNKSPQYIRRMAREGKIKARHKPHSNRWLFSYENY
jgi:hypothetical protein